MAMVVRTPVGAGRVISGAMARSAVRCGVEPTRKTQQVPRRATTALSVSNSGDGTQLRCQAATLTAVRELATSDGVSERGVEMRCIEDSRAALRGSFEAASVSGRAEYCVGSEECRPILEGARFLSIAMAATKEDMAAEATFEQSRVFYGRRGGGDACPRLATTKPADIAVAMREDVQTERSEAMVAGLEAALQGAGCNAATVAQLAVQAWRKLGDVDRAEALYMEALQLAPEDSAIQASYAQFLWQCDV